MLKKISDILCNELPGRDEYIVTNITSPKRELANRELMIDVSFSRDSESNEQYTVKVPWYSLTDFWVGRIFHSGRPSYPLFGAAFPAVNLSELTNVSVATFQETGILYGFSPDEYCVSFTYHDERYVVSCLEIVRSFFSYNKLITNSLLTSEGVESLIQLDSWEEYCSEKGKTVQFAYAHNSDVHRGVKFAYRLAEILGSDTLLANTKRIKQFYRTHGKIKLDLPIIEGGIIFANYIFNLGDVNYIGELCPYLPAQYTKVSVKNSTWGGKQRIITTIFGEPRLTFTSNNSVELLADTWRHIYIQLGFPHAYWQDEFRGEILQWYEKENYYVRFVPQFDNKLLPCEITEIKRI